MSQSSTAGGYLLNLAKTSDASPHTSHVCHADFLYFPQKADTTSQPVKLWKNRIPLVLSGSRATAKSCRPTGIHLKVRPCPNTIHSSLQTKCLQYWKQPTAITRTYVTHALTMMTLLPSACHFFLAAEGGGGHPFQADRPVVNNMLFSRCVDHFCCAHLCNLVCQANKELCLVIIFAQEI